MLLPSSSTASIGAFSGQLETGRNAEKPDFAGGSTRRAAGADAHQLGPVLHLGEAMLGGDRARPVVEPAVSDLLDAAADAAGQVVVVTALAHEERLLAVVPPQR